ncbi:uncharacterized protein LOC123296591 [Chrysoperla carnea]|uniref:uncharacterized protein LOC123296591 n=1 Tax=Chrysoperla carnea TaxID=189513 RepID=UPI001D066D4B|nr:uncharacterized protein LOC123296591 [Chrysoperla carnea]
MGKWKRDPKVPYPSVWREYQVKSKTSDEIYNFQIQDATIDILPDMIDHMLKYYWADEPVAECFDVINDAESKPYLEGFYSEIVNAKTPLVCFKIENDGSKQLVGCNMTLAMEPEDSYSDIPTSPLLKDYISVFLEADKKINEFEKFGVSVCLKAVGLAINRKYRGLGLATEILKARTEFCKALKIPLTTTQFTSGGSQAAARKAGFIFLEETKYADIHKVLPHLPLANIKHPVTQLWYKTIDLN